MGYGDATAGVVRHTSLPCRIAVRGRYCCLRVSATSLLGHKRGDDLESTMIGLEGGSAGKAPCTLLVGVNAAIRYMLLFFLFCLSRSFLCPGKTRALRLKTLPNISTVKKHDTLC